MSQKTEEYLRGVPLKPYDLIREGIVVFLILTVVVFILAFVFRSPDYPTVRSEDVARLQPLTYLKTSANILAGKNSMQNYGPPYTHDNENAQRLFGLAPATWFGVTIPIDPLQDLVIKPLERLAVMDRTVASALEEYKTASPAQLAQWNKNYLKALDVAQVDESDHIILPEGTYGPVPILMNGMLNLGKAGLLEGAIESNKDLPYVLNPTKSLLFFQDSVAAAVAQSLDMTGEQWGISHETGPFPGAWWLWPYTFLYQIPPMSTSDNGDLQVMAIMITLIIIIFCLPFIPILNKVPRWLGVYRLIWYDWYRRYGRK